MFFSCVSVFCYRAPLEDLEGYNEKIFFPLHSSRCSAIAPLSYIKCLYMCGSVSGLLSGSLVFWFFSAPTPYIHHHHSFIMEFILSKASIPELFYKMSLFNLGHLGPLQHPLVSNIFIKHSKFLGISISLHDAYWFSWSTNFYNYIILFYLLRLWNML